MLAKSNISRDPAKVLAAHGKAIKRKYLEACLKQLRHFTPFVVSTDGLIGKEAKIVMRRITEKLADNWRKPYSEDSGYANARMIIAIVQATHRCIRGSRVPTSRVSNRRPLLWEDQAGLSLFHNSRQQAYDARNSLLSNQTTIQPNGSTGPDCLLTKCHDSLTFVLA